MIRGLYTAAAGMIANTLAGDVRANNLANVSTAGFKRNGVNFQSFPEMLIRRFSQGEGQAVGGVMTGAKVRETVITFMQGQLHTTGNTFDLALEGDGFFTLKESTDPNSATSYTRAGNFTINADGYLTTLSGQHVQGKLAGSVWSQCTSWYRTESGRITTNWPLLGIEYRTKAKFDPRAFGWLGSTSTAVNVCAVWHTVPVNSIDDAAKRQVIAGSTGRGSRTLSYPNALNEMLGPYVFPPNADGTVRTSSPVLSRVVSRRPGRARRTAPHVSTLTSVSSRFCQLR